MNILVTQNFSHTTPESQEWPDLTTTSPIVTKSNAQREDSSGLARKQQELSMASKKAVVVTGAS
jgi:hypothetical protein